MLPGLVGQAAHRNFQLQGQAPGLALAGVGQQHHEAITGQAAEQILAPQVQYQQLADGLQHRIAFAVAEALVDGGEVVQVQG
ncbi:hypothetical protein D3C86_1975560 [compost metagenome]